MPAESFSGYEPRITDLLLDNVAKVVHRRSSFQHHYFRWKGIHGWLSKERGKWLFEAALNIAGAGDTVEIGSWAGRSTICLALASKLSGAGKVYAIDSHRAGVALSDTSEDMVSLGPFMKNIVRFNVEDVVVPWVLTSRDAFKLWNNQPIRLLFIDGDHSYEEVCNDILTWGSLVSESGAIAIDDFHWTSVKRAVADCLPLLNCFSEVQAVTPKMAVAYR